MDAHELVLRVERGTAHAAEGDPGPGQLHRQRLAEAGNPCPEPLPFRGDVDDQDVSLRLQHEPP